MHAPLPPDNERLRVKLFGQYWKHSLDDVFTDVAPYYDRANVVASLGLWSWFLKHFLAMFSLRPGQRVLDLCAGTNAVGIALLGREPALEVWAIDRSAAMQAVGRRRATARNLHIAGSIGDVHTLPYPDAHFDIVTLQWASRHLRIEDVMDEVLRVLKPGGVGLPPLFHRGARQVLFGGGIFRPAGETRLRRGRPQTPARRHGRTAPGAQGGTLGRAAGAAGIESTHA